MRKIIGTVLPLLLLMPIIFASAAAEEEDGGGDNVVGIWHPPAGDSKIEIFTCGEHYCGKLIWIKAPVHQADDSEDLAEQPKMDSNNPNPALQKRPIVGLTILENFTYAGDNRWEGGSIYDPRNGKTYRCKMTLTPPNRLEVRGYIGISLFGRTSIWTR